MEQRKKIDIAILLNAFVFPGFGHFYIKQKLMGFLLSIGSVFFIACPVIKYSIMTGYALQFMNTAIQGITAENILNVMALAWPDVKRMTFLSLLGLLVIWLYGIIDLVVKKRSVVSGQPSD